MHITQLEIISELMAVIVVVVIGLLFNPKMRRLLGLKTTIQSPDEEKEESE